MPAAIPVAAAVAGGLASGAMARKGGSTSSVQNSAPWTGVQPYLVGLYKGSRNAVLRNHESAAPLFDVGANQVAATARGDYLNPASNPFLQNYVSDALGQVKSSFAGQYGGAAGGNLGNSGYQEMLTRTLANTALPIYANAYNTERQNQLNAAQLAPDLSYQPLREYSAALQNAPGGQSTTTTPFFTNPMAGAVGGGLLGMQIANGMSPQSQAYNPFGGMSSTPYTGGYGWGNT